MGGPFVGIVFFLEKSLTLPKKPLVSVNKKSLIKRVFATQVFLPASQTR